MSRFAGGVPLVWVAVMLAGTGLTAAASVLLGHLVSPVVVASLPLVAVGCWVVLRYRIGALVLLLLCLPLGRLTLAEPGPVPVSPVTMLAVVVVAVWLWRVVIGTEKVELSHMQLPLAVFLLWGTVGIYGAADVGMAMKILFIFVMGASVYLVASQTVRSPQEARGVLWAAAVAAAIVGLSTAVAGAGGAVSGVEAYEGGGSYDRVEGVFGSPNLLGGFLALAIPPTFALAASEDLWSRRLLGYLLVVAAMAGLAFTYSRGAWLGTGVGLLMLLPVLKRGFWLVLGAVLVGLVGSASAVLARLQSIAAAGSDPAFTSRLEIWGTTLGLVAEHPLLGVGLGNFRTAYGDLLVPDLPLLAYTLGVPEGAHNLFLNLAVEAGLVGAGAFAWLLAVAFLRARQARRLADQRVRAWAAGLAAGLVAILVHTLVDVVIYQGFVAILLFAYLGVIDALGRPAGSQAGYEHTSPATPPPTGVRRSAPSAAYVGLDRPRIEPVGRPEN